MNFKLKTFLRRTVALVWNRERQDCYSQEGEDRILLRLFENCPPGFYVDVGAHHPRRFSNTYLFYRRGWRGINLDATPGSMFLFRVLRPRDTNLEFAVGNDTGELLFHEFDEPALNTLDKNLAQRRIEKGAKFVGIHPVSVVPLAEILSKYLPEGQPISFLTIDVEGADLSVLQSNDWQKFRPLYVLAESLNQTNCEDDPICSFMKSVGYRPFCNTVNTRFFVSTNQRES